MKTIKKVNVANMKSAKGNDIPNQFMIYADGGCYFKSYNSIIAFRDLNGNVTLDAADWDYSNTTGKYRNQFLGETKKETEAKIADGTYLLKNLNWEGVSLGL